MTIIRTYENGNYRVVLHDDGTKERFGSEPHIAKFPESIDLKITDCCRNGCDFCHESSSPDGKHANIEDVFRLVEDLKPGVEVAIGGGNPLEHPHLEKLLEHIYFRGLILNMTINEKDFRRLNSKLLDLCYGIGITAESDCVLFTFRQMLSINFDDMVLHAIAGLHNPTGFINSPEKLLILGFKDYGRGMNIDKERVRKNLMAWRYWLPTRLRQGAITSFDNLALEQLRVRELIGEKAWLKYYMGDDGEYTMYIDAVKMEYAKSSTSDRITIPDNKTVVDLFEMLKIK